MPYSKINPAPGQPPPSRIAGMFTVLETGHWINADETAVQLDTGHVVAVSCPADRESHSQGLTFRASARVLNAAGGTVVDNGGSHIATQFRYSAHPAVIAALGVEGIRRELLLALLGEPATHDADGEPLLMIDPVVAINISIRSALSMAAVADNAANGLADLL